MAKVALACILVVLFCLASQLPEAQSKFTIVNKQKDSQNLNQIAKTTIGKPVKLHLDRVYSVTSNNMLQSQADNV